MRHLIASVVAASALAVAAAGCGATSDGSGSTGVDSSSTPCMVTATGNKLCGQDAAAWCRATDSIRQGSTDPTLQQTQTDCDSLESMYP